MKTLQANTNAIDIAGDTLGALPSASLTIIATIIGVMIVATILNKI